MGRSLGIDVIPAKTCSYDCIYCESGPTTRLSLERECFVEPGRVIRELEEYFLHNPGSADVLTFSGAGEPTLYEPLEELVKDIKKRFPSLPLVVLTNGSMLWVPEVRRGLLMADRVVPSLDSATPDVFKTINRPHPRLDLSEIIEGLRSFSREYRGELHLEILLASGVNDHADELNVLRRIADDLKPRCIELNTIVRPPAHGSPKGLETSEMETAASFFPKESVRIVGCFQTTGKSSEVDDLESRIERLVSRRPCTAPEMSDSLSAMENAVGEALRRLLDIGTVERYIFGGREYYRSRSRRSDRESLSRKEEYSG